MSERPPSKDEALEALDFIVNVLKEHEKDLDKLVTELGTVAGNLGETGELSGKVENVEEKINNLQNQITTLIKHLSTTPNITQTQETNPTQNETNPTQNTKNTPLLLQCKQWEDFQNLATPAQTVSFTQKEPEKTFQVDALKNNQLITYTGETPKTTTLLKTWLSKQLDINEKKIIEGTLTIG